MKTQNLVVYKERNNGQTWAAPNYLPLILERMPSPTVSSLKSIVHHIECRMPSLTYSLWIMTMDILCKHATLELWSPSLQQRVHGRTSLVYLRQRVHRSQSRRDRLIRSLLLPQNRTTILVRLLNVHVYRTYIYVSATFLHYHLFRSLITHYARYLSVQRQREMSYVARNARKHTPLVCRTSCSLGLY